jgi:CxxC motif-containing protein (DUF1111 family)
MQGKRPTRRRADLHVVSSTSALGISGRPNRNGNDGTITRFGWKAQNKRRQAASSRRTDDLLEAIQARRSAGNGKFGPSEANADRLNFPRSL